MKKARYILVCSLLLAMLAGCGNSNKTTDKTDTNNPVEDVTDGVINGAEDAADGVVDGAKDIGNGIKDSVDQKS